MTFGRRYFPQIWPTYIVFKRKKSILSLENDLGALLINNNIFSGNSFPFHIFFPSRNKLEKNHSLKMTHLIRKNDAFCKIGALDLKYIKL